MNAVHTKCSPCILLLQQSVNKVYNVNNSDIFMMVFRCSWPSQQQHCTVGLPWLLSPWVCLCACTVHLTVITLINSLPSCYTGLLYCKWLLKIRFWMFFPGRGGRDEQIGNDRGPLPHFLGDGLGRAEAFQGTCYF